MVFESLVADLINKYLGDFVENLDRSQLKIGIWGGMFSVSASTTHEWAGSLSRVASDWFVLHVYLKISVLLATDIALFSACHPLHRVDAQKRRGSGLLGVRFFQSWKRDFPHSLVLCKVTLFLWESNYDTPHYKLEKESSLAFIQYLAC